MTVTAEKPAPYAPARAILDLIGRYRDRGLASPIDADVLARAGITPSLTARTLYALQVLDLIDEGGVPTQTFEGLRLAPEAEFQNRLEDWLKSVYADVFAFVDPAKDDATRIRDAFRSYQPHGQRDRMVSLFTGLCTAAGIMPERTQSAPRQRPSLPRQQRRSIATGRNVKQPKAAQTSSSLPPALSGLLASLPTGNGWTKARRDKFVETFEAVLDFCVPIVEDETEADENGNGDA